MAGTQAAKNMYLDPDIEHESDQSDGSDNGYDSEAAESGLRKAKGGRAGDVKGATKKRKLQESYSDEGSASEEEIEGSQSVGRSTEKDVSDTVTTSRDEEAEDRHSLSQHDISTNNSSRPLTHPSISANESRTLTAKKPSKQTRPGIIYLPSLPPHLKPSALKNLLAQRGFSPITRLFLTPASKVSGSSKSSKARRTFTEAWLEFPSHRTARRCAETLNANPIGGPKRGYYHDDLWNMRYLRGMTWSGLMGSLRGERREEEVRKGEERRRVRHETEQFLRGVEQAKVQKTMDERTKRRHEEDAGHVAPSAAKESGKKRKSGRSDFQWQQFQVKDHKSKPASNGQLEGEDVDTETTRVLGMIF